MSRSPGFRRSLWVLLLALPLGALAACAWSALSFQPEPLRTGDELLDTFLNTEYAEGPILDYGIGPFGFMPYSHLSLPDEQFEDWETRFGADPRFWMLRYYLSLHEMSPEEVDAGRTYDDWRESILDDAIAHEAADGTVLLAKLTLRQREWYEEAEQESEVAQPKKGESAVAYCKSVRTIIDSKHGKEEQSLMDSLLATAPGESQPYYLLARAEAERGNYAEAIEAIAAGNHCPGNSALRGFPVEWLMADLASTNPLEDKALSGAMYEWTELQLSLPNFIRIKRSFGLLVNEALERGDRQALTELHRFGCRVGNAVGAAETQGLVGIFLVGMVRKAVEGSSDSKLVGVQPALLRDIRARTRAINDEYRKLQSLDPMDPANLAAVSSRTRTQLLQDAMTGGKGLSLRLLLARQKQGVGVRSAVSGKIADMFRELEERSYEEISAEPDR